MVLHQWGLGGQGPKAHARKWFKSIGQGLNELSRHIHLKTLLVAFFLPKIIIEPRHEISNNVVCVTSKDSDQLVHTGSQIKAFASDLNTLSLLGY